MFVRLHRGGTPSWRSGLHRIFTGASALLLAAASTGFALHDPACANHGGGHAGEAAPAPMESHGTHGAHRPAPAPGSGPVHDSAPAHDCDCLGFCSVVLSPHAGAPGGAILRAAFQSMGAWAGWSVTHRLAAPLRFLTPPSHASPV